MRWLDQNPDVIQWASEEPWFCIPYRHPIKGHIARYFPDFWVKLKQVDGTIVVKLIEIKPEKETFSPAAIRSKKPSKRMLYEAATYAVNQAKWASATKYCEAKGWTFQILTEKHLGV